MWILALVAAVAAAGVGRSLVVQDRPAVEVLAQVAVLVVCGSLFVYFLRERRRSRAFSAWLAENAAAIVAGTARYGGVAVTRDTPVRTHTAVVSLLVVSLKLPTRPFVTGAESSLAAGLVCTLTSLLLGWWGIPWGPIWTLQCVFRNVSGGEKRTLGSLVEPEARRASSAG